MPFKKLNAPLPSWKGTGVKAGVRIKAKTGAPSVRLCISKHVYEKLVKRGTIWRFAEGDGENEGQLRCSPDKEGGDFKATVSIRGQSYSFTLGELDCAPLKAQEMRWCQWSIDEESDELVIELPTASWSYRITAGSGGGKAVPEMDVRKSIRAGSVVLAQGNGDNLPRTVSLGEPDETFHKRRAEAEKRAAEPGRVKPPRLRGAV
jgi:hypothetical protein